MDDFSRDKLSDGAAIVHRFVQPTPQIAWPLLARRCGYDVWVKHENHTPIGAFKVRGGLTYMEALSRDQPQVRGVITATRGNHGQSIAFAAGKIGLSATVVIPVGNNPEKNAAMAALGAELIEYGHDFQAAYEHSGNLAKERNLHAIGPWHPWLVRGVASYSMELFTAVPDLDRLYVPVGQGSGISGAIAARAESGGCAHALIWSARYFHARLTGWCSQFIHNVMLTSTTLSRWNQYWILRE